MDIKEREVITMRIKCPNCQGSMTYELLWRDTDSCSTIDTREYECECGCLFEVDFVAENPKILQLSLDKPQTM